MSELRQEQLDRIESKLDEMLQFRDLLFSLVGKSKWLAPFAKAIPEKVK